jgi:alanine-glyoxylate transaminase/serine-glyoxylate transaminase/serine-pyruvate transaminase
VPGLSPVSFNDRAAKVIRNRSRRVQSWFLDLNLVMDYWGTGAKRSYHHTAPVNSLYALHEALVILQEEGLENAWSRHALNHQAFAAGIEAMGLSFVVDPDYRLPQLNAVTVPAGIDEAEVRRRLLQHYSLEIGAGLGSLAGRVWRIGLMGYASNRRNVLFCLSALDEVLLDLGASVQSGAAVAAAQQFYETS